MIRLGVRRHRSRRSSRPSGNRRSDRFACGDGFCLCKNGRSAVIDGSKLLVVLGCRMLLLQLRGHRRNALLAPSGDFRWSRSSRDASRAVVADAVDRCVVDRDVVDNCIRYCAVVHVNVSYGHVVDGAVVIETIAAPVTALIADAYISESIVDPAVVTDMRAPIAVVVAVPAGGISPISRGPQETDLGRLRPNSPGTQ